MTFEIQLPRQPIAALWRSESPATSTHAARLQELFDQGLSTQYDLEKSQMEKQGSMFRLTKGQVFEIFHSEDTIEVPIHFQVKGSTLTWYFLSPMDETHQTFRDELYQSAALGHLSVKDHCEKYWRGTNSLHVKKMHTAEAESGRNHNHYRLKNDRDARPTHVCQHLFGLVEAQREMGLTVLGQHGRLREKFLDAQEALDISLQFNKFWLETNHVGPARTVTIADQTIHLPARDESIASVYKRDSSQAFTEEDQLEWEQNKHKEEPCRSISPESPLAEKLKAVQAGMRGLGSELAQTRQMADSAYKTVVSVVAREDNLA